MTSKVLKPETLSVNKKLLKPVKSTKIRYDEYIISQKLERAFDEEKKQRKAIEPTYCLSITRCVV